MKHFSMYVHDIALIKNAKRKLNNKTLKNLPFQIKLMMACLCVCVCACLCMYMCVCVCACLCMCVCVKASDLNGSIWLTLQLEALFLAVT